ncbi:MAG: DNA mismatch repair protein MutS, partial [Desulfovibrionales bacterium]
NPNADVQVPMCGVPHHASEEYVGQLLAKGHKVAVCEQVEDPKEAKGLVKREVMRVLTPGTVVEDFSLESRENNFLAAIHWDENAGAGGLAWMDVSTGEWTGLQARNLTDLWQWTTKIAPRELLMPEGLAAPSNLQDVCPCIHPVPLLPFFDPKRSQEKLCSSQNVPGLEPLDLEDKPQLVQACGALLSYLRQTQKSDPSHLSQFKPLNLGRHLLLDEVTERNLEIFVRLDGRKGPGTLRHALDRTLTPMGGRLLEKRLKSPWRVLGPILEHQEAVVCLYERDKTRKEIRSLLERVYDLERLTTRIELSRCTPRDFVALRETVKRLHSIRERLAEEKELPALLQTMIRQWDDLQDLGELLCSSITDSPPPVITEGGLFQFGFNAGLDELINLAQDGESLLSDLLGREKESNGLPKLKLGYNRVFGYYFEISKSHKGEVPAHFIRRQTLANSERYITEELKQLEEKLLSASQKQKNLEYELFQKLREDVAGYRDRLRERASQLALLDYIQGLSQAAREWEWTRPELHTGRTIEIKAGRHPAIEACQGRSDYIPNDLIISEQSPLLLITGPNMAGKSTVLRQAAIITILAQIGSLVPAHKATIGIADRIFSRVGASDNLAQGQSTFMVEMSETARILRQAGKRSLVILDEIGRGTSTFDGLALAWAVILELAGRDGGVRTLFATHYHELTDLEGKVQGVRNYNIAVKEWKGDIVFLRRLVPGPADRSYGIEVARLAGVPRNVVRRAKEILTELESKSQRDDRRPVAATRRRPKLPGLAVENRTGNGSHPLIGEIQKLDPLRMTPLQALDLIIQWKEKWGNAQDSGHEQ